MNLKSTLVFFLLTSLLTACNLISSTEAAPTLETPGTSSTPLPFPTIEPTLAPPPVNILPTSAVLPSAQQEVLDLAFTIVSAIQGKDMTALASHVNPVSGLRFSPYAAVKDTDLVFTAAQLPGLLADSQARTWGQYSGSGASIDLTFADYYSQFVYDVDFTNAPQVALNNRLGKSTSLDNIFEFYPGSMVVEFYFPGFDPNLQGMDWRSLRLVFTSDGSTWYLTGVVHDQWTT